jgi:hypothetical protein
MRSLTLIPVIAAATALLAQSPTYHIAQTYLLGGEGHWDYVVPDPPNHRLFVARENRVMVVDEERGTLLGEVTGIKGAHGTAVVPSAGRGFATSGNDQSVVMFDLKSFAVLGRIPAAEDADAIVYDGVSNRVFTLNGDAHSSTVIDPQAGNAIATVALGGKPEYGVSAGDGKVYANLTDTAEVVEIDAKAASVVRRWPTGPCKQPVSMAIDTTHHRLFSGCRSGVMAISDYRAGKVVATVPIGGGVDGAGFDPASGDAFASNADGTLTVIHQDSPDQYHVAETVPTPQGSRNMGFDPTNHRVYLVAAKFGAVPVGAPARTRPPMVPGSFSLLVVERVPPVAAKPAARSAKKLQCLTAAEIDPSRLLPPPPADGSGTQQREMAEVQRLIQTRTPERYQRAKWDSEHEDATAFAEVLGPEVDLQKLPATARLLATVVNDQAIAAGAAKDYFHRKFPVTAADPAPAAFADWTCDTPARKATEYPLRSYPSGHTTLGYTLGIVLANLFPKKAQAIQVRAAEYGYSRQVCGDHYGSDVEAGHALGNAIGILLLENATLKPQLAAAKAELRLAHLTE